MEPGRQGRWEGLGWHIALETEMNRAVNRGCGGEEGRGGRPGAQSKRGPPPRREQGRRQAERRAGLGHLFKLCRAGSRVAMKESMGPQRRPGPVQALLRTRVTGGEAGPSEPKAPLPSVQWGDVHTSHDCGQGEGWHLRGSDITGDHD